MLSEAQEYWVPAFAGMTDGSRHRRNNGSRFGGNDRTSSFCFQLAVRVVIGRLVRIASFRFFIMSVWTVP
ncbi:MAG: hypothetical protein JNM43_09865 [Planctomycetaceae bacterium]|nr:hypothetical protein [Planctomycetaceae bacterium]